MAFYTYIIYSEKFDRYYIGQTQNFTIRLSRHNAGLESATAPYLPWVLKCIIEKPTRSEAIILERKLKNLNRQKLEKFILKYC